MDVFAGSQINFRNLSLKERPISRSSSLSCPRKRASSEAATEPGFPLARE
jgi:hypothetical protein